MKFAALGWAGLIAVGASVGAQPCRADDSLWFWGSGAIHLGAQIGTADRAGDVIAGYLGGDYALLQYGVDLGVLTFAGLGAAVSTRGEVLFTFTPVSAGTDHFQAGIDVIWSPARGRDEAPFGVSLRIPLSFR